MKTALALIGAAVLGYLAITVRSAFNLITPKREYEPEGYRPAEVSFERVTFHNRAGLRLAGWTAIHEQAKGTIVLCHGAWTNHREMESRAEALWESRFFGHDVRLSGLRGERRKVYEPGPSRG